MPNILIVEDYPDKLKQLIEVAEKFSNPKTEIFTATNLRSTYPLLSLKNWDLIILDMTIHASGGVNSQLNKESAAGIEVMQALKGEQKKFPVIVATQHYEFRTDHMFFDSIEELDKALRIAFKEFYAGIVRVNLGDDLWKLQLEEMIGENIIHGHSIDSNY